VVCCSCVILTDLQEVVVNSYSFDEYTAIQCPQFSLNSSATSAVVFLYDSIDKCHKHCQSFHREMKHSYSVIIITILVNSTSVSLCAFMESMKQLADVLPEEVIANGVVINVGTFLYNNKRFVIDFSIHMQ